MADLKAKFEKAVAESKTLPEKPDRVGSLSYEYKRMEPS